MRVTSYGDPGALISVDRPHRHDLGRGIGVAELDRGYGAPIDRMPENHPPADQGIVFRPLDRRRRRSSPRGGARPEERPDRDDRRQKKGEGSSAPSPRSGALVHSLGLDPWNESQMRPVRGALSRPAAQPGWRSKRRRRRRPCLRRGPSRRGPRRSSGRSPGPGRSPRCHGRRQLGVKRSKAWAMNAGGKPAPLSVTCSSIEPSRSFAPSSTGEAPWRRALSTRFVSACSRRARSATALSPAEPSGRIGR